MQTLDINNRIKQEILKPENCHCTYRKLTSGTTAIAYCNDDNKIKADIDWFHGNKGTKIMFHLPIGRTFYKIIPKHSELSDIDAAILSLFLQMDEHWHEAGDDDHSHTDHS